ncbi:unnamed protein product [Phytomonas sp. Hart1]|nr:unnamed protein product [Phytomonas sp. Hart1]|eukprot:CCW67453.1 unnamed protein product [Phytomonas sp. isolate Hart1]
MIRQKFHRATANGYDVDDRLERTQEENARLRKELKETREKLTRVQTQFQRLVADWKRSIRDPTRARSLAAGRVVRSITPNANRKAPSSPPEASPTTPLPCLTRPLTTEGRNPPQPPSSPAQPPMADLRACQASLVQATQEIARLRRRAESAAPPPTSAEANAALPPQEILSLQQQLRQAQAAIASLEHAHPHELAKLTRDHQTREEAHQHSERLLRQALDQVHQEKDALAARLKLMTAAPEKAPHAIDPVSLVQLQAEVREKSNQITLLNSRLQSTQGQVDTLGAECTRLVEQLKQLHTNLADSKKEVMQVGYEKYELQTKCARLEEVELALARRTEEVLQLEQELLKLTDSLRNFNAETEHAVRREMNARVVELEAMRDQADAARREKERALLTCQHDLADANRLMAGLQEDVAMYRKQLDTMQAEPERRSSPADLARQAGKDLEEDEIHRALAIAAIQKRRGDRQIRKPPAGEADATAAETLALYDALNWDETWEQGQLREALATAALDLELSETRCHQMAEQAERHRAQLERLSAEQEALLEENIELRRRVSHVQTVFAKQQLQAYRTAVTRPENGAVDEAGGLIQFCIRGFEAEEGLARALGIQTMKEPFSVFFSLDGLAEYDTMLSPTLHSLEEPMEVRFVYKGLGKDKVTLAQIQHTVFTLQLHQTTEVGSRVVGVHEIPGIALLTARELSVEERFYLIDGTGEKIGWVLMEMCCSQLMLPVLLGQPLANGALLSAGEMRAALMALRPLLFLRVNVFRAQGLASADGAQVPQPYVFYTAHSPKGGISFVRDTVVRTAGNAFTTDPVFDVMPVDHRVVVDRELVYFVAHGSIVFVVFDERANDVRENLGVVEVSLHPLLSSPTAFIRETATLHPKGTLSFGISWITGP